MNVAKPCWFSSHWVHNDWRLSRSTCLQHFGIVVSTFSPEHFDIEIDLGIDSSRYQALDSSHQWSLQWLWEIVNPPEKREFHNGITNVALVQFFHKVGVQVTEHAASVGNQEFSSFFGSLEANKGSSPRSSG